MTTATTAADWLAANQRHLMAAVGVVRARVLAHAARVGDEHQDHDAVDPAAAVRALAGAEADMPAPPALARLRHAFGLSPFECDVLTLCAGVELDATIAPACAAAHGDVNRPYPTFGLALAALQDTHWSALAPDAPLRKWRLVDVASGGSLTSGPLRIDERVLHYLTGVRTLDARLAGLVTPIEPGGQVAESHRVVVDEIATMWADGAARPPLPAIELRCDSAEDRSAIAAAACRRLGWRPLLMPARHVPAAAAELETLAVVCERELILGHRVLVIDCDDDLAEPGRGSLVGALVDRLAGPTILLARDRAPAVRRAMATIEARPRATAEQLSLWREALGADWPAFEPQATQFAGQFALNAKQVHAACVEARAQRTGSIAEALWDACRRQAQPRLEGLATRVVPVATFSSLVVPAGVRQRLDEMATHVRHRYEVHEEWGFARMGQRGLGLTALFSGDSGTGKTTAAEALANALRLDLFRIDLSRIVSKYIGETEKNLRHVFDAADEGAAILLFDEADALFGRRSEVKDSHDRYANIEISYLLQRMEEYRGLAVLTTNMQAALDQAFLRRLRFVVQFPFPDAEQRAQIWRGIFPEGTPTRGLDVAVLARLNVTGGSIRNIALHAAFYAAEAGAPVCMDHVLRAARVEYAKLDRPLTATEIGGWS